MNIRKPAALTATLAAAFAIAIALGGCASSQPEDRVVAVAPPPPVIITPPAATAGSANAQTFQSTLGMTPQESQGVIHLQSFAGDVCISDNSGNNQLSHCTCQQNNCNCQTTGETCNP